MLLGLNCHHQPLARVDLDDRDDNIDDVDKDDNAWLATKSLKSG